MPSETNAATILRRLPALLGGLLALVLATLGLIAFPPVLGGWILAAGAVEPGLSKTAGYVAAPVLFGAAFLAARRARRLWVVAPDLAPRRVQFALISIGLGGALALGFVELVAGVALPPDKVLSGNALHRHLWVARSQAEAATGELSASYPTDRFDPDLGWVPAANFRSERVNVNAHGMRGLRDHPSVKADGEKRIVVTGDSFTWGEDVADGEVYTELLDATLEGTRVINIGVHGYGTDQQYLRLKQVGFDYDPDLVILAFYKSNADRNVLTFRSYAKPRFRLVDGRLRLESVPVPAPTDPRVIDDVPVPLSYSWELFRKHARRSVARTRFAPQWNLTRAILDAVHEDSRSRGARFLLVYIPAARPHFSRSPEAAEAMLTGWAAERDAAMLNLRTRFLELPAERRDRLYAGHWTPEGHRAAAELIAEQIEAEGLLSPRVPGQSGTVGSAGGEGR